MERENERIVISQLLFSWGTGTAGAAPLRALRAEAAASSVLPQKPHQRLPLSYAIIEERTPTYFLKER